MAFMIPGAGVACQGESFTDWSIQLVRLENVLDDTEFAGISPSVVTRNENDTIDIVFLKPAIPLGNTVTEI